MQISAAIEHNASHLLAIAKGLQPTATAVMGLCHSSIFTDANGKASRLPKDYVLAMDKYLPDFKLHETSTPAHRQTCADHWHEVFREAAASNKSTNRSSSRRSTVESQGASRISALYDTFYAFIDQNSPELKHIFRSSMYVRSKVLVHISAGMRSILCSANFAERVAQLTRTHLHYGVTIEMYNPLGNALLHSLKECSDSLWSPEIETSWRHLYAHCSIILIMHQKHEEEHPTTMGTVGSVKSVRVRASESGSASSVRRYSIREERSVVAS